MTALFPARPKWDGLDFVLCWCLPILFIFGVVLYALVRSFV